VALPARPLEGISRREEVTKRRDRLGGTDVKYPYVVPMTCLL
jgi:hypothetical protein